MDIILSKDAIVEKYLRMALKNPGVPFKYNHVTFINIKRLYDFIVDNVNATTVDFEEYLNEVIQSEGCYELCSWQTRSRRPECIYFERKDDVDEESGDVIRIEITF
ncbi:hypothetical protein P9850_12125 [Anoxybacillus rupiensis]|uniref:Uncharacterized protein n=1 Tax=Anoxybacteroides rupiense TaxID=311460 RepID=A0ABD5IY59_9BACL|nr:hypothetical protein [Anoxybacillus rupiensis]